MYEKETGEISYYVVQAIPNTKAKKLYIVTIFIGKKRYKKTPQLTDAQSPSATSKDDSADVSNDIIRKTNKNFNPKTDNRKSLTVDSEGNTLTEVATRASQVVQSKY